VDNKVKIVNLKISCLTIMFDLQFYIWFIYSWQKFGTQS